MKAFNGDPQAAWEPWQPGAKGSWDLAAAGHLFRRAGFGAGWEELRRALRDGPARTIDALLQPGADVAPFNQEEDGFESDGQNVKGPGELRGSWLRRMIGTPDPLGEKMALFWHGWFAVNASRAPSPAAALAHVRMLRSGALGRFDELLAAAFRDPAVLQSNGGQENVRARPNLVFARRLLECFSVGEGQFTERDVSETARAMTGLFVRGNQLRELPHEHDEGEKTILGETGPWQAADVARIVSRHPAAAAHVVRKCYRWLIADQGEPPGELLQPLVRSFAADRDVKKLVATMLRSNRFFSAAAYRQRVKSPVEFAVGLCRALEAQVPAVRLGVDVAALGQDLYHPPTVKGWPGGRAWINPAVLAGRARLAESLLAGSGPYENRLDPAAVAARHGRADAAEFLVELLLQNDLPPEAREAWNGGALGTAGAVPGSKNPARAIAVILASSPEYQLA